MRKDTGKSKPYFMLALFTLLIIATLSLVLIGSSIYGSLVSEQYQNNQKRAVLAYLYSQIRGADEEGAISIGAGIDGPSLVFSESDGEEVYETRIYIYDGNLVEEYTMQDAPLAPERAQIVAAEDKFAIQITENNLLVIETGEGKLQVALRSAGGVAE